MAKFRGPGSMRQRDLLAVWSDKQVTRDRQTGEVNGAYLDIQLNQTVLPADKRDANPHVDTHDMLTKDGTKFKSHTVWYSKSQLDQIQSAGATMSVDGRNVCAFKANMAIKYSKDGASRVIVLTQKNAELAKTPDAKAKVEAYNARNTLGPSDAVLDKNILKQQVLLSDEARKSAVVSKAVQSENEQVKQPAARLIDMTSYHVKYMGPSSKIRFYMPNTDEAKQQIAKDEQAGVDAVEAMVKRDNGFQGIDYALLDDKNALADEAHKHDGIILVNTKTGDIGVHRETNIHMELGRIIENYGGMDAFRNDGRDIVWYDSLERQREQAKESDSRRFDDVAADVQTENGPDFE